MEFGSISAAGSSPGQGGIHFWENCVPKAEDHQYSCCEQAERVTEIDCSIFFVTVNMFLSMALVTVLKAVISKFWNSLICLC